MLILILMLILIFNIMGRNRNKHKQKNKKSTTVMTNNKRQPKTTKINAVEIKIEEYEKET